MIDTQTDWIDLNMKMGMGIRWKITFFKNEFYTIVNRNDCIDQVWPEDAQYFPYKPQTANRVYPGKLTDKCKENLKIN